MYTRRNYPIATMLNWTRRYIYIFVLLSAFPVVLYEIVGWKWLHLPWLPIGLVGTALAFIIGFKNNASYDRLWEARKIWGGIVNASRSFTLMVNDFITNEHATEKRTDEELFQIRRELTMRHIAWMTSLRHALRSKKPWESSTYNKSDQEYMKRIKIREYEFSLDEELEGYLSEEEKELVLSRANKQTACLTLQSKQLKELKLSGLIEDFRHMEMQNVINDLLAFQGQAERIKNFPYPRQFATLNLFFVWIFIFLLPFGLMNEFDEIGQTLRETVPEGCLTSIMAKYFVWLSVPFSTVIAWVFLTMERIGDVTENPFEGIGNDVPITSMARAIEIDIRQMIGDEEGGIPNLHPPEFDTQM